MTHLKTCSGHEFMFTRSDGFPPTLGGRCVACGNWQTFDCLTPDFLTQFDEWDVARSNGWPAARVNFFRADSSDLREFMLSGICPACFDSLHEVFQQLTEEEQ